MFSRINIKVSNYFQFNFIIVGWGMIIASVMIFKQNPIVSIVLIIIGLIILTTHYRIDINANRNTILEYLWLFGFRIGKIKHLGKAESIRITSATNRFTYVSKYSNYSTKIGQPRAGKEHVYKGFLKVKDHDELVYLGERRSLITAEKDWKGLATKLNVPSIMD